MNEVGERPFRRNGLLPFGLAWGCHGLLLLVFAGLLGPMQTQVHSQAWLEAMETFGVWNLVKPIQTCIAGLQDWRIWLALVGLVSSLVGGLAVLRPGWARWPLHGCAALHLILIPWAAWAGHRLLGDLSATPSMIVSEIVTTLVFMAGCVVAIILVERQRRGEPPPCTQPPPP